MHTNCRIRRILGDLGMIDGLAADNVHEHLGRYDRLSDIGQRGCAFYLLQVEERRLYQHFLFSSTVAYAESRHDVSPRRTRELIAVARALEELPAIDAAFCEQQITWSRVVLLSRVASPQHEDAWLEKAKSLPFTDLKREVTLARKGGPPREPGDTKGTPAVRYRIRTTLGVQPHEMLNQAQRKLSEERGRGVTLEELIEVMTGLYLDMEREGESAGWHHVPSSLYRIVLRPAGNDEDSPLWIETQDGLLPMHGSSDEDVMGRQVIERQREACACCDGEVVTDTDGNPPKDPPTPPAMRRRVLARDGHRCRCCRSRRSLHVHHITWRSRGGSTKVHNLLALCSRCHALVHEGMLRVEGTTQKKARFVDDQGRSIHEPGRRVDPKHLLRIETPARRACVRAAAAPGAQRGAPLDDLPDTVDATWWRRHADLVHCRADQSLELRPGTPLPEGEDEAGSPAPEPSETAFEGIVGQDTRLERFEIEAAGGRALGEAFPHTLFTGSPGTGKTTLAEALAARVGARLVRTSGPLVRDVATLLRLLASLAEGDMLFLDEVHAVPRGVLEILYEAMAEGRLSLTFRQGAREKAVSLHLPAFTVLAATTRPADLPRPLVTRFALREHLDVYGADALAALADSKAAAKGVSLTSEAADRLAETSRGIPREVLRLTGCAARHAAWRGKRTLDLRAVEELLRRLGYDEDGLGPRMQSCLALLRSSRDPIPAARLARLLGVDVGTLVDDIEPWLVRRGLIRITPRGRRPALWSREREAQAAEGLPPHFKPFAGRRNSAALRGAESSR